MMESIRKKEQRLWRKSSKFDCEKEKNEVLENRRDFWKVRVKLLLLLNRDQEDKVDSKRWGENKRQPSQQSFTKVLDFV